VAQQGPLPCAVETRFLPEFERGERRLRAVLAGLDTAEIQLDENLLVNVNTPQELEEA
jgi:molybdopterin-guanine dinucleotide biosynthesis protein A